MKILLSPFNVITWVINMPLKYKFCIIILFIWLTQIFYDQIQKLTCNECYNNAAYYVASTEHRWYTIHRISRLLFLFFLDENTEASFPSFHFCWRCQLLFFFFWEKEKEIYQQKREYKRILHTNSLNQSICIPIFIFITIVHIIIFSSREKNLNIFDNCNNFFKNTYFNVYSINNNLESL